MAMVFADEPAGNLDSQTSEDIFTMFHQLKEEEGITIILVTHGALVGKHAPRIIQIYEGVIVDGGAATADSSAGSPN